LQFADTGAGPGAYTQIGSVQNLGTLFPGTTNRIYLFQITSATIPCMNYSAIGNISWRFRYTAAALLSGPFTLQTGFLGKLYPST
jgi:hypothetical protein